MKTDWKKKLTSRKFWAAVCGFTSMLVLALGKDAGTAQTVTGMIMAAGSLIAYIIGEGLADGGVPPAPPETAWAEDPFAPVSAGEETPGEEEAYGVSEG